MEKLQIEVKNISFFYETHEVLSNVSFVVKRGEYLGIIGPNGGGKTTLLKIILGILKPSSGEVVLRGKCGYVPQKAAQDITGFPATAKEVVSSGKNVTPEEAEKAMKLTGVEEYKNNLVSQLSGGERQKVFIAHSLALNPEVLILDEPSAGVDIASQERFYSFLEKLNKKGITVIFVSHDINIVAAQAKKVLCLGGKTICYGTPQETLSQENINKIYGRKTKFFLHQH
jgi:zinc transport system ATP-binding protein